jgi:hypothetical protein
MNSSLSPFPLKDTYPPFGNVDQHLVNIDASNWPGGFSSKANSLEFGLPAMRNNVQAAAASALQQGGSIRRKIKNISKKYRMPKQKRRTLKRNLKRRLSKLKGGYLIGKSRRRGTSRIGKSRSSRSRRSTYGLRGGNYQGPYLQYESDVPLTPSFRGPGFAVGPGTGISSALANPVAITRMVGGKGTLCNATGLDNYNRFQNNAFQTNGYNTGFTSLNSSVFK